MRLRGAFETAHPPLDAFDGGHQSLVGLGDSGVKGQGAMRVGDVLAGREVKL